MSKQAALRFLFYMDFGRLLGNASPHRKKVGDGVLLRLRPNTPLPITPTPRRDDRPRGLR